MNRHPWREVEEADGPYAGRGSFLGPGTARRSRWWRLRLKPCGHTEERTVRYRRQPGAQRGGTQHRSGGDVLPAPKRVRCGQCPEEDGDG